MLTAIIPIDLDQRPIDILKKSIDMAKAAELAGVPIVFGHNNRGTIYDKIFIRTISKFKLIEINSGYFYGVGVNTSLLRNKAFYRVKTDYIVLLDVDIWPDFNLLNKYSIKIAKSHQPFYIMPCLYLTKYGSKKLISKTLSESELKNKFYNFSRKEFLHLASPSSVTIMKSDDYSKLKGFDEKFNGHGYEDFDFLMRLCDFYKKIPRSKDLLVNKTARSPLFLEGFRKYIGEMSLEILIEKDMVFHIFHKKDIESKYYTSRPNNFDIFKEHHKHLTGSHLNKDPTLLTNFIMLCGEKNIPIEGYSILFENKPGHIDRFDTLKKRFNFLLNK